MLRSCRSAKPEVKEEKKVSLWPCTSFRRAAEEGYARPNVAIPGAVDDPQPPKEAPRRCLRFSLPRSAFMMVTSDSCIVIGSRCTQLQT